jgi:Zn-dependent hydrolases, including glyoxylases
VRYGIALHPVEGPVLIDTGYDPHMMTVPAGLGLRLYRTLLPPRFDPEALPGPVLARMGASLADVRHVIVTHLHADHVAGLHALPAARLHLSPEALRQATGRLPRAKGVFAELLPADLVARAVALSPPETPGPLGPMSDIFGDGSLFALPLPGHARGHLGLWSPGQELLYATDAAWTLAGLRDDRETRLAVAAVSDDVRRSRATAEALRGFIAGGGRVALCHDPAPLPEDLP